MNRRPVSLLHGDMNKIYSFTVKIINQTPRVAKLVEKEAENDRKVYHLKDLYKDRFIHFFFFNNPELLTQDNYVITKPDQLDIIHWANEEGLTKFKIYDTMTVPDSKKFKFYKYPQYNYKMIFGMMKEKIIDHSNVVSKRVRRDRFSRFT